MGGEENGLIKSLRPNKSVLSQNPLHYQAEDEIFDGEKGSLSDKTQIYNFSIVVESQNNLNNKNQSIEIEKDFKQNIESKIELSSMGNLTNQNFE